MREIKFRRWDTDEKYMYYDKPFHMSGRTDRFVYMQNCGLKDKNGKEIYEGDIVAYEGKEFIIEYNHSAFKIKTKKWALYPFPLDYGNLEVVGNVYENPELIKS